MSSIPEVFENEITFEEELEQAKIDAADYKLCKSGVFRNNISNACYEAYEGIRSVPGFIKIATAIIKDEEGYFSQFDISARLLFINSLKSQDIDLEILRDENPTDPLKKEMLKKRTECLTSMISGLVETNAISIGDCKMHFSSQLLKDANIIPNKILFDRRLVRLNTAMLYKQHKFNLTREDSEGYAGLINDLTYSSIDNERDSKGKLSPTPLERIPEFLTTISSHIGVFHLDPNRVLDILLDFFIKQLTVNYTFWIALIKSSGWIQKLTYTDYNGEQSNNPSAIMAQLIGFRFYNYHNEEKECPPKELYLAIAILLKNGLILLGDILPHMYPYDDDFDNETKEYCIKMNKEITTNSGGKLATYGALGEEGSTQKTKRVVPEPSADLETSEGNKKQPQPNDVVELVKALFSVGDLKHAFIILANYDKLVDIYPHLAYDIYRLCRFILHPAYEAFVPEKTKNLYAHFAQCAEQSQIKVSLSTQDNPNPKIPSQIKLKRVLVTDALLDDVQDLEKKERYVFFYREWAEDLELCEVPQHLTTRFMPLMRLAGYRAYLATDLIQKLILVVSGLLERVAEFPDSRLHCLNMIREFLLPAVSFSNGNPGTMASVWEILCRLTYQERYSLYGEWNTDFFKKNLETKLLKARVDRAVKSVMRRVSKNDVRRCGRDLGKLAHSNPTIVFNIVLDQVQSFDNMAPLMADACRYLGDFSYDVIGYLLAEKWTGFQGAGKTRKEKEKDDGMPAVWLRALAVFSGMLFKKQDIDATPLLRYLAYRLRYDDSVADLILLNEFVTKMGGVEILASACTNDQIIAAGCSDSLKSEAFLPISMDNRRASRRVLNRLKESLRRNNVGFEILVLLYRLEEACTAEIGIPASDRCSKLDRVHQTQLQYFELLTSLFEGEEFSQLIPDVDILVNEYNIPLNIAMNFNRPKTQFAIKTNIDAPIVEGEVWAPFKNFTEKIPSLLPDPSVIQDFSAEFYVIFWQLGLYDIYCPVKHYETAMARHTEMIRQCQDTRSSFYQSNRPSVVSKTERQAQASLEILREDLPRHKAHVEKVVSVLKSSEHRWFPSPLKRQALISNILQYCLLPRSRQSEIDAAFCFEFIMLMHQMSAKNFSSLTLFDKVLSDNLPASFIAFSEYETTIHSRFIFKTLQKMGTWHHDEKLYLKEAHGDGLIGFQKNWNAQSSQVVAKEDLLSFSDFQRVLHKWHFKACTAIEQALKSNEAHLIKNAFLVLRQFMPCFPAVTDHGNGIIKIVKRLSEKEDRGNIKVLARSYIGLIAKYKSTWISKNAFLGLKEPTPPAPLVEAAPPSENNNSSSNDKDNNQPSSTASNASTGSTNGNSRRRRENETTSKPSSPARREGSNKGSGATSPVSSERKRPRESEPARIEKTPRIDESATTARHRTNAAASTSKTSPRDTKESNSRISTPTRDPIRIRDPAREAIREAVRDTARESVRTDKENPAARTNVPTSRATTEVSSSRTDDRVIRSNRTNVATTTESNSTRHTEDRSNRTAVPHSSPPSSTSGRGAKRPLDVERERDRERQEKRSRDMRDERTRDDRRDDRVRDTRRDDRRMDERRMDERKIDERRMDDRRVDDRRDRERDYRGRRRR
ncbi:transcription factor/nuclear export subunit protein 2-domain-containing protein [Pilobolus umbonatus]|nr:transcription factor/nuclear export subunit protein 2-domain-containing protein [Pilobolus umbonatus]